MNQAYSLCLLRINFQSLFNIRGELSGFTVFSMKNIFWLQNLESMDQIPVQR